MSFHRDRVLVALFVLVLLLSFQRSAPSQTLDVEAAKKEGKLVAYGTIVPKVMEPVHRGFEKKYGIKVEYWRANATQVVERALSEWQAGRPDFDLTFAIHGAQVLLKAHGVYAKYSPPSAEMFPGNLGQAADGLEAVALTESLRPDVVLMDVRMPRCDGIEATGRIKELPPREDGSEPRVVILTTFDLDEYVFAAFRAGASGFLLKDSPRERILEAVHSAAAGDGLVSPSVTRRLIAHFASDTPASSARRRPAALDDLTPRESEVLELIGRGLSNTELAAHLVVSEKTVKTHVGRILMKLGLRDRVQAVILAYEAGIVVPGERE